MSGFRRRNRLRTQQDFDFVRRNATKYVGRAFIIQFAIGGKGASKPCFRLGVIASRRVGNAVKRNRAKRLMREVFRLNQDRLPEVCDVVMIARNRIFEKSFLELQQEFLYFCRRYEKVLRQA